MNEKQKAFQAFEQSGWETAAETYADFAGLATSQVASALLDAAGVVAGHRVLDVASGPGYVAAEADARGGEAVGLDIAEAMVEEASRRHPDIDFRQGSAESLPFGETEFDSVVSAFGMPHFADHEAFFSESYRVLKPGGRLAYATWKPIEENALFGVILGAITREGRPDPPDIPEGRDFFAYAERSYCARVLGELGFRNVDVRDCTVEYLANDGVAGLLQFIQGTVRTRALYESQTDEAKGRIAAHMAKLLEPYRSDAQTRVPAGVVLVSASRS